jgi:uncharacterized Ntn-hydrolase superfamily protein
MYPADLADVALGHGATTNHRPVALSRTRPIVCAVRSHRATPEMPAATYSIVAFEPTGREWGAAVQSRFPAVGALVPWVEVDAGAIATQAWMNVTYGRDGLALLRGGRSAQETVEQLVASDNSRDHRQLGIIDRMGDAANFTGEACLSWAGGRVGDGYAAQGNTLVSANTLDALTESFEGSAGRPLAERLLGALIAAHAAGGDRRGQQAAALKVVRDGGGYGGCDIAVDLRVDDSPEPLTELARLYDLHRLYFGSTPEEQWVTLDAELRSQIAAALARLGYASGEFEQDLDAWAGTENFEERVFGAERLDPVVIEQIRTQAAQLGPSPLTAL